MPVSVACAVNVYVVEVAPVIFVKVFDPLGAICHCTVLFTPSTAVKVAVLFGQIVRFAGWVLTTGAALMRVAALVVAVPQPFVKTARYCLLLSPAAVVKL